MKSSKILATAFLAMACAPFVFTGAFADNASNAISAQSINQQPNHYIGKKISLSGNVDRVLGPGAYIISDRGAGSEASHKILVLVPGANAQAAQASTKTQQRAGVAAQNLKEGDSVQLQGKVEQLSISNETEKFSPKAKQETINEAAMSMPVVVARNENIQKQ